MARVMLSVFIIVLVGGFLGLYTLSLQVRALEEEIARLERSVREEHEALRVLEAEWAYLNRPDYIQGLIRALDLKTPVPFQIASFDDLSRVVFLPPVDASGEYILPRPSPVHVGVR